MARTKGSKNKTRKVARKPVVEQKETQRIAPGVPDVSPSVYDGKPVEIDLEAAKARANKHLKDVYEPQIEAEAEQAIKDFEEVIATEKELLEFFSEDKMKLQVTYHGKRFDFNLRQVNGRDDLSSIQLDLSIYSTLTDKERQLVLKGNEGLKPLSTLEQKLYEKINAKLENDIGGKVLDQCTDVLAQFVSPPAGSVEENKKFWETRVSFDFKTFVASEVMGRLGITQETDVKLFQAS